MEEEKKNNNSGKVVGVLLAIIFVIVAFGGGYFIGNKTELKENKDTSSDSSEKVETSDTTKAIPTRDLFAILGYGYEIRFYMIDSGSIYYMFGDYAEATRDILLTHSGCLYDNSTSYCQLNSVYSKKAVKVEGLSNVARLKLYNTCHSGGENFGVFAITEDGNVYELNGTSFTKVFGDSNVEDMLQQTDNDGIVVLLKDGTKTNYKCQYRGVSAS